MKLSIIFFLFLPIKISAQQLPKYDTISNIGRRTFVWTDSSRNDPWISTEKRKLMVILWYPTTDSSTQKAAYFPGADKIKGNYTAREKKAVLSMSTNAIENAKINEKNNTYPVILFSPGADMPTYFYTLIIEKLASRGYVVAAIEHTYEGVGQVFPDGTVTAPEYEKFQPGGGVGTVSGEDVKAFYRLRVNIRSNDASFVLDQIIQLNKGNTEFAGKFDLQNVGIFGHSIGGVAAAQTLLNDERFKAAINYDGLVAGLPFFSDQPLKKYKSAFMFIGKPLAPLSDRDLKKNNMTPQQDEARIMKQSAIIDSLLSSNESHACRITILAATHQNFSDVPFFQKEDQTSKNEILGAIATYTIQFFDKYLKQQHLGFRSQQENGVKVQVFKAQ